MLMVAFPAAPEWAAVHCLQLPMPTIETQRPVSHQAHATLRLCWPDGRAGPVGLPPAHDAWTGIQLAVLCSPVEFANNRKGRSHEDLLAHNATDPFDEALYVAARSRFVRDCARYNVTTESCSRRGCWP